MKDRIKIDSAVLSFVIILTGFLYQFPYLYSNSIFLDDSLDFLGLLIVLLGNFCRMVARGHKKMHSNRGHGLVTSGPYAYVRNPMYLGSFLMGLGFILIVWPWWSVPIFAFLFYQRFNIQIRKEEEHLKKHFGKIYEVYMAKVPRLFPDFKVLLKINYKKEFPEKEVWSTKERNGVLAWPVLALFLEMFQEHVVFGFIDIKKTIFIFLFALVVFLIWYWSVYRIGLK